MNCHACGLPGEGPPSKKEAWDGGAVPPALGKLPSWPARLGERPWPAQRGRSGPSLLLPEGAAGQGTPTAPKLFSTVVKTASKTEIPNPLMLCPLPKEFFSFFRKV